MDEKRRKLLLAPLHWFQQGRRLNEIGPGTNDDDYVQHGKVIPAKRNGAKVRSTKSLCGAAIYAGKCIFKIDYSRMIRAQLPRRTSPFSAFRVSTISGA